MRADPAAMAWWIATHYTTPALWPPTQDPTHPLSVEPNHTQQTITQHELGPTKHTGPGTQEVAKTKKQLLQEKAQDLTAPLGVTAEELGLLRPSRKLVGMPPTKMKLAGDNKGYGGVEPTQEADEWLREFEVYMSQNSIPEYAWVTYAIQFTEGRARTNLQSWRDGLGIAADLHVIAPWKVVKAEVRDIAGVVAKRAAEHRREFRTATLEKVCCDNLGHNEAPRDVLLGLELLTRLAQKGGRSVNKKDQGFLEDIVTALPEHIRGQCVNVHSADGALEYNSIVNVLRTEGPKLQEQWKAKMEDKKNHQLAAKLQAVAAEDRDPQDDLNPEPKRQRTAWTRPTPSVSQASVLQPVQIPAPTTTHVAPYPSAAPVYVQHVTAQPVPPTIQLQYQQPLALPAPQQQYPAYQAAQLPATPPLQPAPAPPPPQPHYPQQQYAYPPQPHHGNRQQQGPPRYRQGGQDARPRQPVPPARFDAAGNLLPPDPLPEGWHEERRKPTRGPFYSDYAAGRLLWVRTCSIPKWDYARTYGACKVCLSKDHYCQACPSLQNMRYGEDFVFYHSLRDNPAPGH